MPVQPRHARSRRPLRTIVPATDLGSVEVAKDGNLYLLTDRGATSGWTVAAWACTTSTRGSCRRAILRVNGVQLTVLRGPYASTTARTRSS